VVTVKVPTTDTHGLTQMQVDGFIARVTKNKEQNTCQIPKRYMPTGKKNEVVAVHVLYIWPPDCSQVPISVFYLISYKGDFDCIKCP